MEGRGSNGEIRRRHEQTGKIRELVRKVGTGIIAASLLAGGLKVTNDFLATNDEVQADKIARYLETLNYTDINDGKGVNSLERLQQLQKELGDKVLLKVRPKYEHTGVISSGDRIATDINSPLSETETKWDEVKGTKKYVLLGEVHYDGPMSVATLSTVGPDGIEFYKSDDTHGSVVDMSNPIMEVTTEGLVFYGTGGSEDSRTTRVTISPDNLLKTVTNFGNEEARFLHNRDTLSVNGQPLLNDRLGVKGLKRGEDVVAELENKAHGYIMMVLGTNAVVGLGIDPTRSTLGETDRIVRSGEIKIGELENGDSVTSNFPSSFHFS